MIRELDSCHRAGHEGETGFAGRGKRQLLVTEARVDMPLSCLTRHNKRQEQKEAATPQKHAA
jgi:hypothetical protein